MIENTVESENANIWFSGLHSDEPISLSQGSLLRQESLLQFVQFIVRAEVQRETSGLIEQDKKLALRIGEVDGRILQLYRELLRRNYSGRVVYVDHMKAIEMESAPKLQKPMKIFYLSGLACSIIFGVFLALSSLGIRIVHPFISLVGMVGGLGWVTTAWADVLAGRGWDRIESRQSVAETGKERIAARTA
jgi:hypothetical protein